MQKNIENNVLYFNIIIILGLNIIFNFNLNDSIYCTHNKSSFWGLGAPYDMTQPYDEKYGYDQWAKGNH